MTRNAAAAAFLLAMTVVVAAAALDATAIVARPLRHWVAWMTP